MCVCLHLLSKTTTTKEITLKELTRIWQIYALKGGFYTIL